MEEIWKDIEGFEGLYQVSNWGRVYSLGGRTMGRMNNRYKNKPRIIKSYMRNGYEHVLLKKEGKQFHYKIHRLVAIAFIPNPNNYPFVNHKDENKLNNNVENLEWCTAKYNLNYGTHNDRMKMTKSRKPIAQFSLDGHLMAIYLSSREIERLLGIAHGSIDNCCKKKYGYKSSHGYKWEYATKELMEEYNLIENTQNNGK